MRIDAPSFVLGFFSALTLAMTRKRLRPVFVELGSLGLHLAHVGRAILERSREDAEDLWAEVEERVRERAQRGARGHDRGHRPGVVGIH